MTTHDIAPADEGAPTTQQPPTPDPRPPTADEVEQCALQLLGQTTAAATTAMMILGDRLGLFATLAAHGALTSDRLAELSGARERYVREWLSQQAAAGILAYEPSAGTFTLPPAWAAVLTDPGMIGVFLTPAGMFRDLDAVADAFRTGEGIAWGEHDPMVHEANEKLWAGQYRAHLVDTWIPALDGVAERLESGATVADVGAGRGAALMMLAEAYPRSRFVGFDNHESSIRIARERAAAAGVADRVRFEVATCHAYAGQDYDLVTFLDTFHDLGDPAGAASYARNALADGGCVVLVEPQAADDLAVNLTNPAAAIGYAASTFLCTPSSLSQPVGLALGAQGGERTLRAVLAEAGFGDVRRVADSPLNMVFQARP